MPWYLLHCCLRAEHGACTAGACVRGCAGPGTRTQSVVVRVPRGIARLSGLHIGVFRRSHDSNDSMWRWAAQRRVSLRAAEGKPAAGWDVRKLRAAQGGHLRLLRRQERKSRKTVWIPPSILE